MEPQLSPDFLDWISNGDFSQSTVLEIGSGGSTFFFSKHFKQVYSYENDLEFFTWVENETKNINNVNITLFKEDIFQDLEFKKRIIESDIILIDNNEQFIPRHEFAYFVDYWKKEGAYIVLDNGDWNIEAYEFLRSKYYCWDFLREDRIGDDWKLTQTTVFLCPRKNN